MSASSPTSLVEMNNNSSSACLLNGGLVGDIVSLLQLKDPSVEGGVGGGSGGCEGEDLSHASSLESVRPLQGSHSPSPSRSSSQHSLTGSTSCSESSFEMASSVSFSEEDPSTRTLNGSKSPESFQPTSASSAATRPTTLAVRESIEREVSALDTQLPSFDFAALERSLLQHPVSGPADPQAEQRKRIGEEVRRRLALETLPSTSAASSDRPPKCNRQRMQLEPAPLQVCYMNEMAMNGSETPSESDDDDDEFASTMRTSKSAPDFKQAANRARHLRTAAMNGEKLSPEAREDVLRAETLAVQARAAEEGRNTVEEMREERRRRDEKSDRYSRHILSKMTLQHMREIAENLEDRIDATNAQLMTLLMAKDSLHMERDSLYVDIGDLVEGHRSTNIDIVKLLRLQDSNPQLPHDLSTPT